MAKRILLVVLAVLFTQTPPLAAQQCAAVSGKSGGYVCKASGTACSPVTDGSGNAGTCTTEGSAGESTCECKGKPENPPPPPPTKPSDVFFYDASNPDQRPGDPGFAPLNKKPAASIVAKNVTVRGWLIQQQYPTTFSKAVNANEKDDGGVHLGYEDVHYDLVLDYDYIASHYGWNIGVFQGATLHGNPIDSQTQTQPTEDMGPDGKFVGIDINSFWLPNSVTAPITLHTELNSWHTRDSHRCGLFGWFCGLYQNYTGRGPAPAGWIEKEYTLPLPNTASDNWWPFDPDNPDGLPATLGVAGYVEIQGTLWQDSWHDSNLPSNCWAQSYHNHDGWLEIHPVDSLRRLAAPGPSPLDDTLNSANAGIKRASAVSFCTDGQGSDTGTKPASMMICPEQTYSGSAVPPGRTPKPLVAHFQELIDNRFSVLGPTISHSASAVADCVKVDAHVQPGARWARFKATYVVWWTAPAGQ